MDGGHSLWSLLMGLFLSMAFGTRNTNDNDLIRAMIWDEQSGVGCNDRDVGVADRL